VGLQDQTREEARESLAELKANGVRRIAMVSGDRTPVARRVGAEIGCEEVVGDCLPQNKVEFVRATKAKGYRVAVVGTHDGRYLWILSRTPRVDEPTYELLVAKAQGLGFPVRDLIRTRRSYAGEKKG
jgi:hypothetical protein